MKPKLKKLSKQVIVITGATSGIGLTTARHAAKRGAKLMLVARGGEALEQLRLEFEAAGCDLLTHTADVADDDAMREASRRTIERFGGFDTWINNAGISIYGRLTEVSEADHRRLFETNFWGLVRNSLLAVEHLKTKGGALINVGSEASAHAIPLQGMYSASKHAVKGFTDALRIELEQARLPISVTLIRPTGIDTMFPHHAKNYLDVQPQLPPPVYAPEVVAQGILAAAERPIRDVYCGGPSRLQTLANHAAPGLVDKVAEAFFFDLQKSSEPRRTAGDGALYQPGEGLRQQGDYRGIVQKQSFYTRLATAPIVTKATLAALGAAGALLARASKKSVRS